ncbi:MAG: VOC family protein [Leptolyngbya sp. RL_3_1]|nr:VOC family protein [Leptolyngbya sp. RL_3_1]
MGIRDSYEHGVFSWVDLVTTDPEAAKTFYSQLFDWRFEDIPVPDSPPYCMAFKGDRRVSALFAMPESMQSQHIPSHWQSYINVTDLAATVELCKSHGGEVLEAAFDVMGAGQMAVVKDPTGAVVNLWQAKTHIGAELVNEVNTYCWAELQTRGANRAVPFYESVFGWEMEIEGKPPYYITGKVKGHLNCGIFDMDNANLPAEIPPKWAVYFNVADLDASLQKLEALGGKALMEPVVIEPGRFTTIMDPQGAVLTIMELKDPDD